MNYYFDSVQKQLNEVEYFKDADLENIHQKTKNEAVEQVIFCRKDFLYSIDHGWMFQIGTDVVSM